MADAPSYTGSEIAVVGMSGRFPGAANLDQFWRNLADGVESVYHFTDEELVRVGESAELLNDPDYVRARPVLADIEQFDADFFGFSPQDAAIMDPQHRIFLEVGWEALERAGYDAARFNGQVGVFATCGMNSYMMYHLVTNQRIMRTVGEWLVRHTGNDMSFLATSLSYHLDLKGPSLSVQCACSSALVAIHLATQSLLSGECDMALAGGSVVLLPQDRGYLYQSGEILSRDGHCRAFDANATGTLFGSGAGVVVLRRLADAIADGDQILAVIKGSAVNNDGSMKVGFLAPSVEGQSRVITEALAVGGIEADSVSVHRSARHRHHRRRSDRSHGADRRVSPPHRSHRLLLSRIAQVEHRASRRSGRRGGLHQDGPEPAASTAAADAQLRHAESADRLRGQPVRRQRPAARVDRPAGRAAPASPRSAPAARTVM